MTTSASRLEDGCAKMRFSLKLEYFKGGSTRYHRFYNSSVSYAYVTRLIRTIKHPKEISIDISFGSKHLKDIPIIMYRQAPSTN